MNYTKLILDFASELKNNANIDLKIFEFNKSNAAPPGNSEGAKRNLHPSVIRFYAEVKSLKVQWENKLWNDPDIAGEINLLPYDKFINDWKNVVYFEDDDAAALTRFFHPLDLFVPEACVGVLLTEDVDPILYFNSFGDELVPMYLDIDGYLEMMLYARGFFYWQMALVSEITGDNNAENKRFKKYMPKLFDGFDYREFIKKYNALKKE